VGVTSKKLDQGNSNCEEGGSEFVGAESKKTYACNGSPWTDNGTLPSGKTEAGIWATAGMPYNVLDNLIETLSAPISFTIPLAEASTADVIGKKEGEGEEPGKEAASIVSKECGGTFKAPEAAPGHLCVFVKTVESSATSNDAAAVEVESLETGGLGAGKTGGVVEITVKNNGETAQANGTWAVTAK
jgi:hypothetical protein